MGNLKYFFLLLISLSLLVLFSCSRTTPAFKAPLLSSQESVASLSGSIKTPAGQVLDLTNHAGFDARVLILASDSCSVCAHEAQVWRDFFKTMGFPKNIQFLHVLIGADETDVSNWKNAYQINWTVALDQGDNLFRTWCRQGKTPCLIIENFNSNKSYQTYEPLHFEQVQERTGPWQF